MPKIVIGIDPDSKAHGVAVYIDGELIAMDCLTLTELMTRIESLTTYSNAEYHIEDVCSNNASFHGKRQPVSVQKDIGRRIGMVQQAQTELIRVLEHYLIPYKLHKPSKQWKKNKAQFEMATGWAGRSNEDTRSAAYFGFLGCK